jgi:glycerophosphoryl diester phosphodiesterase
MKIIAHRGGAFDTPENTLASFANAIELDVEMMELDIHLSKDGIPVVIHDATLDRTTNAGGPVRDRTAAELRQIDAGKGEYVPQLSEVFELAGDRTPLVLEFKAVEAVAPAIELIRAFPQVRWSGLSAFPEAQEQLKQAFPEMKPITGSLGSVKGAEGLLELLKQHRETIPEAAIASFTERMRDFNLESDFEKAAELGAEIMIVYYTGIDAALLNQAHQRGLKIGAWTVNDPADAQHLLELGTDFLITDDPKTMKALVENAGAAIAN